MRGLWLKLLPEWHSEDAERGAGCMSWEAGCLQHCLHLWWGVMQNHRIPRRGSRLGRTLGVNVMSTGTKCRCNNEMNKKKSQGPFWD